MLKLFLLLFAALACSSQELKTIPYIETNISGTAYSSELGSYFFVTQNGSALYEVDLSFNLKREIKLFDMGQTQDVSYLGTSELGPELAIINNKGQLFIFTIGQLTTSVKANDIQVVSLYRSKNSDHDISGMDFNLNTQTFYVTNKNFPMQLYSFQRPTLKANIEVKPNIPFNIDQKLSHLVTDLAAVISDPEKKQLIFLSHQSKRIIFTDFNGLILRTIYLNQNLQPKDFLIGPKRDLIIVSSPYHIAVWPIKE